jgi:ammonia channel protein AmtB
LILGSFFFLLKVLFLVQIFASHGLAGFSGSIFTGIFAQSKVFGGEQPLGWLDKHWKQVPIQLAVSVAAMTWAFSWTVSLKSCRKFFTSRLSNPSFA